MLRILLAEDEAAMQKIIRLYLEQSGYETDVVSNGEEAMEKLCSQDYDLLIADWMMPKMSGIELCKAVREHALPTKIIMLTAKSEVKDEVEGLQCGADDYIKKPFEPRILLLRIQKLFGQSQLLRCGLLSMNEESCMVFYKQEEIHLTQKEFQLLQIFMHNQGITLTREMLLDRVWGDDYDGNERTLDTHIRRLRRKIGQDYITTYVGVGYRMEKQNEEAGQ